MCGATWVALMQGIPARIIAGKKDGMAVLTRSAKVTTSSLGLNAAEVMLFPMKIQVSSPDDRSETSTSFKAIGPPVNEILTQLLPLKSIDEARAETLLSETVTPIDQSPSLPFVEFVEVETVYPETTDMFSTHTPGTIFPSS